jgi:guanylate kinase
VEEVKIRFLPEESTLLPLFKVGSIDILNKVPVLQADDSADIGTVRDVPVEAVTYLAFNIRKPPFNELKNRLAIRDALAGSKKVELARLLKTGEVAAPTFLPSILIPSGAVRRERSPTGSKGNPELTVPWVIQSDMSSRNKTLLEYVQSEIKDELGWRPTLDLVDWKAHYARLKTEPGQMFRFGWQNPVSDPYVVYQVLTSKSPNNFTGWSNPEFDELVENHQMLEWAVVHGQHRYGTPRGPIDTALDGGSSIILEIDIQGARQVKHAMPEALLVFLLPPSWEELVRRLQTRGTEGPEEQARRLETAKVELDAQSEFDVTIVNDDVDDAAEAVVHLMTDI